MTSDVLSMKHDSSIKKLTQVTLYALSIVLIQTLLILCLPAHAELMRTLPKESTQPFVCLNRSENEDTQTEREFRLHIRELRETAYFWLNWYNEYQQSINYLNNFLHNQQKNALLTIKYAPEFSLYLSSLNQRLLAKVSRYGNHVNEQFSLNDKSSLRNSVLNVAGFINSSHDDFRLSEEDYDTAKLQLDNAKFAYENIHQRYLRYFDRVICNNQRAQARPEFYRNKPLLPSMSIWMPRFSKIMLTEALLIRMHPARNDTERFDRIFHSTTTATISDNRSRRVISAITDDFIESLFLDPIMAYPLTVQPQNLSTGLSQRVLSTAKELGLLTR